MQMATTFTPQSILPHAQAAEQPYRYPPLREFVEPDWTRIPGYAHVTSQEWESARWQRQHTIKNLDQLRKALGPLLPDDLARSIERDGRERATMSMLLPPQMLNTMDVSNLWDDPIRRYMIPAYRDRHPVWPSHPMASR